MFNKLKKWFREFMIKQSCEYQKYEDTKKLCAVEPEPEPCSCERIFKSSRDFKLTRKAFRDIETLRELFTHMMNNEYRCNECGDVYVRDWGQKESGSFGKNLYHSSKRR